MVVVEVAARPAPTGRRRVEPAGVLTGRELDLVDLVALPFVVDQRAGAELADRDEARAVDELAVAGHAPTPGDIGAQRQTRERVARQEALGGEVAVGVEVALLVVGLVVAQQAELIECLPPACFGHLAGVRAAGVVEADPVLLVDLGRGDPVQLAPPVQRPVELPRGGVDHPAEPVLVPPRRVGGQFTLALGEHPVGTGDRPAPGVRVGSGGGQAGGQREPVEAQVEDRRDRAVQRLTRLGQPDGMDVGAEQVLVGEVEPGRRRPSRRPSGHGGGSSTGRGRCRWRNR